MFKENIDGMKAYEGSQYNLDIIRKGFKQFLYRILKKKVIM